MIARTSSFRQRLQAIGEAGGVRFILPTHPVARCDDFLFVFWISVLAHTSLAKR
jgi:hypothetical protein